MVILGIDPGAGGAIVAFDPSRDNGVSIHDMPVIEVKVSGKLRRRINIAELAALVTRYPDCRLVVIEDVFGVTGQSASAAFTFGFATGAIHGACVAAKLPIQIVHPAKWKKTMGVPKDKGGARQFATRLFPHLAHQFARIKDDGRAEALLLAVYGERYILGVKQ